MKSSARKDAFLILEDGRFFQGKGLGELNPGGRIGEVVFNTSLSGYQEIITDPSYKGQIVCFTYPSIGNYGVNDEDSESEGPYLDGIIVGDYCEAPSNFRSTMTLEDYLSREKLTGITGIDTRALVRHIRESGSMVGGIFEGNASGDSSLQQKALAKLKSVPSMEGQNLTGEFSGVSANKFIQHYTSNNNLDIKKYPKVAVLDFGIKYSILRHMIDAGIYPVVFAGDTPYQKWDNFDAARFQGFFLSNGPGDPAAVTNGIENITFLLSLKKPLFGICLGHQMLSIALGAKTFKLKFGHHGGNQPVKKAGENRVIITAQNHGFSVKEDFFGSERFKKSGGYYEINPNDNTVEGFFIEDEKIISVQYHPEAGPGPEDALGVFTRFRQILA